MPAEQSRPVGELALDLLEFWRKEQPRRATGGWWALSGFAFQTSTYLLHFFKLLTGQAQEPGQLAEMERLSDILCPSPDLLTLIQVKRTLTSSALFAAIEEAYLMTDTCRRRTPDLLPRLRFQIACSKKDTSRCVHDVQLSDVFPGDDCDAACWQAMMQLFDPAESIIVAPDSMDTLHTLLWTLGIANTSALIDRCVGFLLTSFDTPSFTSRALGRGLSNIFYQAERRQGWKSLGRLLTTQDVEPNSECADNRGILTGQTPKLEHLRSGYFRHRPALFEELYTAFRRWVHQATGANPTAYFKIPVFWISGRSGEGKSVLLLQLVARAIRDGEGPILHLASRRNLADLISTFSDSTEVFLPQARLLAVVDDLYAGRQRDQWNDEVRESLQLRTPPVSIVTCGPTEQLEAFESQLCDLFEITSFEVPRLSDQECEEFLVWFERRTGQTPQIELQRYSNPLLVQLLFELSHNERLPDFARRFRHRLDTLSLASAARTVLAVNALYLDAPLNNIVSDTLARDALERLCAQDQLHFRLIEDSGNNANTPGVHLAHSHLSWKLFVEWIDPPATLSKAWARELSAAVGSATDSTFEHDVLARLRTTPWLSDHCDLTDQTAIRQEFYDEYYRLHVARNNGQPSAGVLADWLQTLSSHPGLVLSPDPLLSAVTLLTMVPPPASLPPAVGAWALVLSQRHTTPHAEALRDAAERFFEAASGAPDVQRALTLLLGHRLSEVDSRVIRRWLERHGTAGGAYSLLCRHSLSESVDGRIFHQLVLKWLTSNPDDSHAFFVLAPLLPSSAGDPSVLSESLQWIARNPSDAHQPFVLAALARAHPWREDVREYVRLWITRFPHHKESPNVLGTLVAACRRDAGIAELALSWLAVNQDDSNAWWVLGPLIKGGRAGKPVFQFALRWLGAKLSDSHARFVLVALLSAYPAHPVVTTVVKRWLQLDPAHAEEVLHPWLRQNSQDRTIKELCLAWFDNHRISVGGATVLAAIVKCFPTEESSLTRLREWFDDCGTDSDSKESVQRLIACNSDLDLMVTLTKKWLCRVKDDTDAQLYPIFQSLLRSRPVYSELGPATLKWLDANRDHSQHDAVLACFYRAFQGNPAADEHITKWLDQESEPERWRRLQAVLDEGVWNSIVKSRGSEWLQKHRDHPNWITFLIAMVRKFAQDGAVADLAKEWLAENYQERRAGRLYPYLLRAGHRDDITIQRAMRWLDVFPDHEQVPHVIEALVRARSAWCTHELDRYLQLIEQSPQAAAKHDLRQLIARALVRNGELIRNYLNEQLPVVHKQQLCDLIVSAIKWHSTALGIKDLQYVLELPHQFQFSLIEQLVKRRVYSPAVDELLITWLAAHVGRRGQPEVQYRSVVQALRRDLIRVNRLGRSGGLVPKILDDLMP